MQESVSCNLPSGLETNGFQSCLPEELPGILTLLQNELLEVIGSYYYRSRGKVHHLQIQTVQVNNPLNATLVLSYQVNFVNGCQDLTYDQPERMTLQLSIDHVKNKINITGEEFVEREPDEF
jgi:hypothetical protein